MKLNKARQMLSDKFLSALKEDKIPWKRGWRTTHPSNAVSNNHNVVARSCSCNGT